MKKVIAHNDIQFTDIQYTLILFCPVCKKESSVITPSLLPDGLIHLHGNTYGKASLNGCSHKCTVKLKNLKR